MLLPEKYPDCPHHYLYGSHPHCQQRDEQGPQHQPLEATSVCKRRVKAPTSCSVSCCGLLWRSGDGLVVCESLGTCLPLFPGQVGNFLPDSWLLVTFSFLKSQLWCLVLHPKFDWWSLSTREESTSLTISRDQEALSVYLMGTWGIRSFRESKYDQSTLLISSSHIKMPEVRFLPLQET